MAVDPKLREESGAGRGVQGERDTLFYRWLYMNYGKIRPNNVRIRFKGASPRFGLEVGEKKTIVIKNALQYVN